MARTVRKFNPAAARWAYQHDARKRELLLKGARVFRGAKCQSATVDRLGNARLNTHDDSLSKSGALANRQLRRAGKLQARLWAEETSA